MRYIKRAITETIKKASEMFGAVLVTGPRQVGKTTVLKEYAKDIRFVTLDDSIMMKSAIEDGGIFLKDNPPPIFIDEIQYAPNLFPYIKMILDENHGKGLFLMSGSQQFQIMKNVSESLAGRLGIINLLGLSLREIENISFNEPFLPSEEYFQSRKAAGSVKLKYDSIWKAIQRGTMPELYVNSNMDIQMFYGSYVKTYIERDVRKLAQVGDELKFMNFMTVVAANTAQMLNLTAISRNVGISQPTAERWLSILCGSGLVYLLHPYYNNISKRTVKTPKLYFLDTALAAYLTRWNSVDVLKSGSMAGAFFETYVISEIIKSYYNAGYLDLPLYYYRDKDMREIDLLIEKDGTLYPIEIKKNGNPDSKDISSFCAIDGIDGKKRGSGGVVCMYENLITLKGEDRIIPVSYL